MEKAENLAKLPPPLSVYIDLLRVLAALLVLVSHYPPTAAMAGPLSATNYAYDAVVVFFVLSGYVISYSAKVLERNFINYATNRIARIMPVAVAAILFSSVIFFTFTNQAPHIYGSQPPILFWLSTVLQSLTFTNQVWNNNEIPFYNGPYWSLAIEVWCYILYGAMIFTRTWTRAVILLLLAFLLGPKTIIMFPMWLAGSVAFHLRDKLALTRPFLVGMLIIPIFAYWGIQIPLPRDWSYAYAGAHAEALVGFGLEGAANFGWGYILAILVALHLYALGELCKHTKINGQSMIIRSIRKASGYTFTLYLFHIPLITLILRTTGISIMDFSPQHRLFTYGMIFLLVYFIGNVVEHKKSTFRAWAHYLLDPFNKSLKAGLKI